MNFELLLERAKTGDKEAREEIFRMYRPLLIKNAMDKNVFDEDLYQELSATLLNCIQKFRIRPVAGAGIWGNLLYSVSPLRIK